MAEQHGVPGEWARVRGIVFSMWPLLLSVMCFGAFLTAFATGEHPDLFGGLFLATVVAVVISWRKGMRRVERYFRGAHGEEAVARMLAALPDAYHVFHDYAAGRHRVDHVVVGPGGIFAVETKNWRAPIRVAENYVLTDGALPTHDPVKQAIRQADAVRARLAKSSLTLGVTPVLCFASGMLQGGIQLVRGTALANVRDLNTFLMAQPAIFSPDELERVVMVMASGT